jgi:hypothetical protein
MMTLLPSSSKFMELALLSQMKLTAIPRVQLMNSTECVEHLYLIMEADPAFETPLYNHHTNFISIKYSKVTIDGIWTSEWIY